MKAISFQYIASFVLMLWLTGQGLMAQCSQCKAAAAAVDENGNYLSNSINTGILYLLALPVLLPIIVGGVWWYLRKVRSAEINLE
ncbi:MAG: hypothetical protein GFH27_549397n19 [Chloroflexi bacterium AL-W]|nr:hypothetical protein [Chloroflexi bacterium AL-W]